MTVPTIVIAGTASGVGKTTVATGLIAALVRRGLTVQPFKVGPDYIDPSYHAAAAGRPSRNLDSWLLAPAALRELFARAVAGADVAVIEGVMGLYDGKSGGGEVGSTAHVAKLVGGPVVLVLDAAKTARSAAAVALGFNRLDPALELAGVVLNNVASQAHYAAVAAPITAEAGLPVLGWLGRDETIRLEERYLGLIPVTERKADPALVERLGRVAEEGLDLGQLLQIARRASPPPLPTLSEGSLFPSERREVNVRIALARDEAFTFYYEDNLDLLRAWGAELVPFSPCHDDRLPPAVAGVYLGGGFPELFADGLAANRSMLDDLRRAASDGMPIYGECGGLIYLGQGLVDREGRRHRLVGLAPGWSSLERGRLTLGYREVVARSDSPLLRMGERIRGHEFHWSVADAPPADDRAAYDVVGGDGRVEGYAAGNVLASYVHLHFASDPRLAPRFVEACRAWARRPLGPNLLARYGLPPAEIEALSARRILAELGDRLPADEPERSFVARLVYAAGDPELVEAISLSAGAVGAAAAALAGGARLVVDVRMVAAGLNGGALGRFGNEVLVAVEALDGIPIANARGVTRSAAGILALAPSLDGAVVAIGNAPTALLALLDLVSSGVARPAAVIGLPVGFVAATEAKEHLLSSGLPYATIRGTRGGSPLAAAAINFLLRVAGGEPTNGRERAPALAAGIAGSPGHADQPR